MSIAEEQLAELERLEREATPGPWGCEADGDYEEIAELFGQAVRGDGKSSTVILSQCCPLPDAALIVAARNALPDLLAEVRRLRAIVDACARAGCPTAADGKQVSVFVTRFGNYEPAEIYDICATRESAERAIEGEGDGRHVEEWKVLP